MASYGNISAWIALFVGLYSLTSAVGELRSPGMWDRMLDDFEKSPGLCFVTGFVVMVIGAAIYLANPWQRSDWLSMAVSIVGGIMVAEGALMLASGDRLIKFGRKLVGRSAKPWAGFAALLGIAAILVAIPRLNLA